MDHYASLGLTKGADNESIKKAYRKLALKHHPDKGGDENKFKQISEAYDILSDPEKKSKYDKFGADFENMSNASNMGMNMNHGGFNMHDVFGTIFGNGVPQRRQAVHKETKHPINVPILDFYTGKTYKRSISRIAACTKCSGKGGKRIEGKKCEPCNGKGYAVESAGGGFSSIFQTRTPCQSCSSTGSHKTIHGPCGNCKATGKVSERVIIEPVLEPGDMPGKRCVFKGMGNYTGTGPTGDVVIVINQIPNQMFTRRGSDIHVKQEISLKQCLTGFAIDIDHIDDSKVHITSNEGRVTPPGTIVSVQNSGIPKGTGNFIVTIGVKFPKSMSKETVEILEKIHDL